MNHSIKNTPINSALQGHTSIDIIVQIMVDIKIGLILQNLL